MRALIAVWMALLFCSACGDAEKKPDTLITSGFDEQEMEAAIARARAEVDSFIAELAKPTGENHAVKAAITDKGQTEHFWLVDVSYRDGAFEGTINNEPGMVTNVRMGQKWKVPKGELSDWMYMHDGKLHGNYTLRPLLKTMPEEEAAKYRSMLAEP